MRESPSPDPFLFFSSPQSRKSQFSLVLSLKCSPHLSPLLDHPQALGISSLEQPWTILLSWNSCHFFSELWARLCFSSTAQNTLSKAPPRPHGKREGNWIRHLALYQPFIPPHLLIYSRCDFHEDIFSLWVSAAFPIVNLGV